MPETVAMNDSPPATNSHLPERFADARQDLERVDQQVRLFVKEHPLAAVGGAVALGFLVGRIVSRL